MVYRALGVLFSDSGYSVAFSEFHENAGSWTFTLKANNSYPTGNSVSLIEKFIEENNLQYQVALITVHAESPGILFNGASVAAATGPVVRARLPAVPAPDRRAGLDRACVVAGRHLRRVVA